jgi:hypothetical protein
MKRDEKTGTVEDLNGDLFPQEFAFGNILLLSSSLLLYFEASKVLFLDNWVEERISWNTL